MASTDIWRTLGIPRSSDTATIRRAYVAQLRTIDIEVDPAAFMALRRAFEQAIEKAEELASEPEPESKIIAEGDDYDENDDDEGCDDRTQDIPPLPEQREPADWYQNQRSLNDWRDFLGTMITAHGVWVTWKLFNRALAKGDIALTDQTPLMQLLMTKAVKDETLPQAAFMTMIKTLGLEDAAFKFDGWQDLTTEIKKRLDAYHWLDALKAIATGPQRGKNKYPARAARIFLSPGSRLGGDTTMLEAVAKIFSEYHEREIWLRTDLDSIWLQRLEANLLRVKKIKAQNSKILVYAVLMFFGIDFLYLFVSNLVDFLKAKP
ncbi:MAG TPA: hypothetical protein PK231_03135 [Acidocella sp.]|nr:hypothetical protein [Acidocella sp.]